MDAGVERTPLAHNDDLRRGVFQIARVGIFPKVVIARRLERVGQLGEGEQTGSVYKQPEREVDDSFHNWRVPSK